MCFWSRKKGIGSLRATLGDEDTVGGVQVFFSVYLLYETSLVPTDLSLCRMVCLVYRDTA